jgi:homoserine kinase type II
MAVYTKLQGEQIDALLRHYQLGTLHDFRPVLDGIDNTNYFVSIKSPVQNTVMDYLLTLFEHLEAADLAFYLGWLAQLKQLKLPVAPAILDITGQPIQRVAGKPSALFDKLPGSHPNPITTIQCAAIGRALGKLHRAALDTGNSHQGGQSLPSMKDLARTITPKMTTEGRQLLDEALAICGELEANSSLPAGLIHGDLFPDNTLFEGEQLCGIVDFFSGGQGLLGFDLAVAINAWCAEDSGQLDARRYNALMGGYHQVRHLSEAEQAHWGGFLVLAATRFWLSRQADQMGLSHPDNASAGYRKSKDPALYQRILSHHLELYR